VLSGHDAIDHLELDSTELGEAEGRAEDREGVGHRGSVAGGGEQREAPQILSCLAARN